MCTLTGKRYSQYAPSFMFHWLILRNEEVLKEIHTVRFNDDMFLRDYCDRSFCKNHPLFSDDDTALQIVAYFDELEVTNPIGSYVNIHKLGCLLEIYDQCIGHP